MSFADFEPEDAWSPGDPPAEQVHNIATRLTLIAVTRDVDLIRLEGIVRHLEQIRDRLRDG